MTSPLRLAVLPAVTVCLVLGGCTAFEPLADQSTTPGWVRERLVNDVEGHKAPPAVPANSLTAGDVAQLDRDAAEVLRRRTRQAAEIDIIFNPAEKIILLFNLFISVENFGIFP